MCRIYTEYMFSFSFVSYHLSVTRTLYWLNFLRFHTGQVQQIVFCGPCKAKMVVKHKGELIHHDFARDFNNLPSRLWLFLKERICSQKSCSQSKLFFMSILAPPAPPPPPPPTVEQTHLSAKQILSVIYLPCWNCNPTKEMYQTNNFFCFTALSKVHEESQLTFPR